MYRRVIDTDKIIQRISDGASIPCTEENIDYKEYLEWAKTHTINPPLESK